MRWHMLLWAALAAGATGPASADSSRAAEPEVWHDVTLLLEDGLGQGKDLEVYLGTREGRWDKHVQGWAAGQIKSGAWRRDRAFNAMDHEGTVAEVQESGRLVNLRLDMTIHADPWVPGGPGQYVLELIRTGQELAGTFTGTFRGQPVKGKVGGTVRPDPWPSPVAGYVPLQPAEHPRMIFRKGDLAALKARAETPEGKAILGRLRMLLGQGGEDMPERYSKAAQAYGSSGGRLELGDYTLWHGCGFGLLYQLTGDRKYADFARQCVEKALQGVRDRDARYSWVNPGGKLRAGPSYSAIALAYDLAYDGWDDAFRRDVARRIQEKVFAPTRKLSGVKAMAEPVDTDLVFNTGGGQHSPLSNHYGAWNGGGGMCIVAILGDPGSDDEVTARCHRVFLRRAKRALLVSYGSRAYFYEGHHCGRLNSNTGLVGYLHSLKSALGLDMITPSESAQWLLTKWTFEITRYKDRINNLQRGMYARGFDRGGQSSGGDFSQGFGICPDAHKPAVLYFYNNILETGEKTYDAISYPHRAVYAFANWPIGLQERDPAEVLGHVLHDREADYYVFRSGWRGDEDVVATMYHGNALIQGRGVKGGFSGVAGEPIYFKTEPDGTTVVSTAGGSLAADFTGLSGAPALFVTYHGPCRKGGSAEPPADPDEAGLGEAEQAELRRLKAMVQAQPPPKPKKRSDEDEDEPAEPEGPPPATTATIKTERVAAGGRTLTLVMVCQGPAPQPKADGDKVVVGRRSIAFDGEKLVLGP